MVNIPPQLPTTGFENTDRRFAVDAVSMPMSSRTGADVDQRTLSSFSGDTLAHTSHILTP